MKKVMYVLLIAFLLLAYAPAYAQQCDPSGMSLDPFELRKQETVSWCWAASAQMTMQFHGKTEAQCFIVDVTYRDDLDDLGISTCCGGNENLRGCIRRGWPDTAFDTFDFRYSLRKVVENRAPLLTWSQITNQICQRRPFIFAMEWAGGGKHTYVVKGYEIDSGDGEQVVWIYDHNSDEFTELPFDVFLNGLNVGDKHYRDYINVHPER